MKPSELFGVVVRTIGLLVLLSAVWATFLGSLGVALGGPGQTVGMLFFGIPALLIGLWLMRSGAHALVRFAYPDDA